MAFQDDYLEFSSTVAATISLDSHQNIRLHTGARVNSVLLSYLLTVDTFDNILVESYTSF